MSNADEIYQKVRATLAPSGLVPMGWFSDGGSRGLLIGNLGSSLWSAFSSSPQYLDGKPDPMNRWTVEVVSPLALSLKGEARFPFGEPVWPFQEFAKRATGMRQSPIGLLIHPKYGLWTAFRAALVFDAKFDIPSTPVEPHPCDHCVDKPCLSTCPISAFTSSGYDYVSCKSYVASPAGSSCKAGGCLARHACPVGQEYAYEPSHQAFHMKAYI